MQKKLLQKSVYVSHNYIMSKHDYCFTILHATEVMKSNSNVHMTKGK